MALAFSVAASILLTYTRCTLQSRPFPPVVSIMEGVELCALAFLVAVVVWYGVVAFRAWCRMQDRIVAAHW